MKLRDLIEKVENHEILFINGKAYSEDLSDDILEKEVVKINIEVKKDEKQDLGSLGYSFEVGM